MQEAVRRGETWIAAWNSRDLERILALYDDDAVMASEKIRMLGLDPSGTLHGKERLRAYWQIGLARRPGLRFDLVAVSASPDSIVVRYRDEHGHEVDEYLRYAMDGLIVQGSANHPA
ncbi:MAG TPA: nuclear transport factor 2 family protein [Beijerinckiaceae bacterium]|nr:nuclear transport factor 2 family protein [Beijerinckiaceae bacterium]